MVENFDGGMRSQNAKVSLDKRIFDPSTLIAAKKARTGISYSVQ